ncbi:hypothetical protein OESDEN_24051, partial [Oesophagostomum dentatum]
RCAVILHFKTPETGQYTRCAHGTLEAGPRPETMIEGSKAFTKFRSVVLNQRLQEDLVKASPYGGTSSCEAKNALDRIYCRKEIYYPKSTYPFYAKMATMHFNTLRLAEMAGERVTDREIWVQRKHLTRRSRMVFKSPVHPRWRDEVLEEVLNIRKNILQAGADTERSESIEASTIEVMNAEDAFDSCTGSTLLDEDNRAELIDEADLEAVDGPSYSEVSAPLYIAQAILRTDMK